MNILEFFYYYLKDRKEIYSSRLCMCLTSLRLMGLFTQACKQNLKAFFWKWIRWWIVDVYAASSLGHSY